MEFSLAVSISSVDTLVVLLDAKANALCKVAEHLPFWAAQVLISQLSLLQ